ncbi:MAG: Mut7-C RNAse domain-containing protein [Chloroflexi bacterium]|nr:Mut7-C RNAse domain-containing protein [Chloroflexota bacterium]
MEPKFIVDSNVGKLAKWLRMMGYDALFFDEEDDGRMVKIALAQGRIIITKDSEFMKRRVITAGRVKAILVSGDNSELQMQKVIDTLQLNIEYRPFTRCIECNVELISRERGDLEQVVPARVFAIQEQYMECPSCHRIYWRGTHWQAMSQKLKEFSPQKLRREKEQAS